MKRFEHLKAKIIAGLIFAAVALAPFPLLLVPNPKPVPITTSVAVQPTGAYITSRATTYRVFPRAERVNKFPADSLAASGSPTLWVRYRQPDDPRAYALFRFVDDRPVPVERKAMSKTLLKIWPKTALDPGRYYLKVSRDSIYGGDDFVYFSAGMGSRGVSSR